MVQWLGLHTFTGAGPGSIPGQELRSRSPCGHAKNKKQQQQKQETSVGKDVKKREPLYNIGGNVKWDGHYGKQYGCSSKKLKIGTSLEV